MDMDKIGLCSCGKKYATTNEMMACARCNHGVLPSVKQSPQTEQAEASSLSDLLNATERLERDMADGGTMVQACEAYAAQYGGSTAALVCLIKMRETLAKIKAATGT